MGPAVGKSQSPNSKDQDLLNPYRYSFGAPQQDASGIAHLPSLPAASDIEGAQPAGDGPVQGVGPGHLSPEASNSSEE